MPESISLLYNPCIGIQCEGKSGRVTLPEYLSMLGDCDEVEASEAQAHQRLPWFAFVTQLAAMTLARVDELAPKQRAEDWAEWLSMLWGKEAWQLVTDDLRLPAFMQPPIPHGTMAGFDGPLNEAGAIDLLITSKNHDVKTGRFGDSRPGHWIHHLVTLQTCAPYSGGGAYYGTIRMNGGSSSRCFVGCWPAAASGIRFRRDVSRLLQHRTRIAEEYGYGTTESHALMWTLPWDGTDAVGLEAIDPWFIDCSRRIRLQSAEQPLHARGQEQGYPRHTCWIGRSKGQRIAGQQLNGDTGDPWMPIRTKRTGQTETQTSLTLGEQGWSYRLLRDLLFSQEYKHGIAGKPDAMAENHSAVFLAGVLASGNCKTYGYREVQLSIPASVASIFDDAEAKAKLDELSSERVNLVQEMQRKALRPAICCLLQGAPEQRLDLKDNRVGPWMERFDTAVGNMYF